MLEEQHDIQNKVENILQQPSPRKKYQPAISYGAQFGILIGFVGIGLILGSFATLFLWERLTHTSFMTMQTNMLNPAYSKALEIIQVVVSAFTFLFPVIILAVIVSKKPFKYLGFNARLSKKQIFLVILIALVGLFLISGPMGIINEAIPIPKSWQTYFRQKEDAYNEAVQAMATMKTFTDYLISLLVIAVAPAVMEESFFRGGLQQLFVKWFKKAGIAIIITSVIFSIVHASYYGFLARAALGVILGLIFYYGKNIWLNAIAHFINNGIAITQVYVLTKAGKSMKEIMNDDSLPFMSGRGTLILLAAVAMLAVGIYIMILLFKVFKKEAARINTNEIDNTIRLKVNPFDE
jgi:membrane protease YdiL (CAAX protease family)